MHVKNTGRRSTKCFLDVRTAGHEGLEGAIGYSFGHGRLLMTLRVRSIQALFKWRPWNHSRRAWFYAEPGPSLVGSVTGPTDPSAG